MHDAGLLFSRPGITSGRFWFTLFLRAAATPAVLRLALTLLPVQTEIVLRRKYLRKGRVRYLNLLLEKFKEVVSSVIPITVIVLILHFTISPLETYQLLRFLIGSALIIVGLSIFLAGVDISITPMGGALGRALAKTHRVWKAGLGAALLGFLFTVAEPDLHILAEQVHSVTMGGISKGSILFIVSIGVALLLALGFIRILYNIPLYKVLTGLYLVILALGIFASPEFLAISFDASGSTTGSLTVPFILALALGVSAMKRDSKAAEKDSFGLSAIASVGAIIAVLIMSLATGQRQITGTIEAAAETSTLIIRPFLDSIPALAAESALALAPLLGIFIVFQAVSLKMPRKAFSKIIKGFIYAFIGLVLFLCGVNTGFLEVGRITGYQIASMDNKAYVLIVGFILGFATILAEPSVHILTHQIEEVTSGAVKRRAVLASLAIGVGVAVVLAILKILIPEIMLWHYLLPGYLIAIAMTYITPKLFVGIGFDSGGVAAGTMTATFILPYAQGTAEAIETADVLLDGFGIIAMVALIPLIALQILGLVYKVKSQKSGGTPDVDAANTADTPL